MSLPRLLTFLTALLVIALLATPALAKTQHLRGVLVRGEKAVDADAKGKIQLETKTKKGDAETKLRIQAQKLTGFTSVDFVLFDEDDDDLDDYTFLRADVAVEDGSAKLTLETKSDDLIDGEDAVDPADDVAFGDLADTLGGRLVGVLDHDSGDVILFGILPAATTGKKKDKTKSSDFGDDEKAKVSIEWRARDGRIRLSVKTRQDAFGQGDQVTFLLVWNDGEEQTFVLGKDTANDEGQVKLKLRTDHGDPLPPEFLGDHDALGGLTVKIFIDTIGNGEVDGGETVVEGTLPEFK